MYQMLYYISGPIAFMPNKNKEAFDQAAKELMNLNVQYINPLDLDELDPLPQTDNNHDLNYLNLLRRDITYLMSCDGVVVLPGWEASRGATLEVLLAIKLDMPIFKLNNKVLEKVHIAADVALTPLFPSFL